MADKKLTGGLLSVLMIKIAIMIVLLVIAAYLSLRLDFSRGKIYSLAEVSRQSVRKLEDRMVVKIYASEELPPTLVSMDRYLRDILAEYKTRGRGKFLYQYVKANSPEHLRDMAQQNGLKYMVFQSFENDQMVQKEVIYGLTIEYQGKIETLSLQPNMESKLEYILTTRFRKLYGVELPRVVVFRDSSYQYFPTDMLEVGLDQNYQLTSTDLVLPLSDTPIMLFTGVLDSLHTEQLYNLDQYIMKGGKVVFLQDRVTTDGQSVYSFESNLFTMLASYGVGLGRELVLDLNSDSRRLGGSTDVPYPFYPVVRGGDDNIITRNISGIALYLASEVSNLDTLDLSYTPILKTSPYSNKLRGPNFPIEQVLQTVPRYEIYNHPPITVGAIFKGDLPSYFAGDPVYSQRPGFVPKSQASELIVYGDRELMMDPDNPRYADRNFIVFNAIDYLRGDESMINIRSRSIQTSFLDVREYMERTNMLWGDQVKTEKRIKNTVRAISMLAPPLLLMALIFVVVKLQNRRRKGIVL
jgi:gliding-associated putative ABC transporter substrate-binding component GldG